MIEIKGEDKEFLLHNDALSAFNEELYSNIFTGENVAGKKKALTIGDDKFYGYYLEKGKKSYFAIDDYVDSLPFKAVKMREMDYKGDVFNLITDIIPISIPAEKRMSFRELVDLTPAFQHTRPKHFLLYKILSHASRMDRLNARVTTDAGFGKDSVVNIIGTLVDSMANIYGATFAKLEYSLLNNLIIFNEMGNLKKDDKTNMQEFLLAVGAYFNNYTKRSRKTASTQEQYDISKTSLLIFYNLPEYYSAKGQEYFDDMFTKAVTNRFLPFVFEGRLTTPFEKVLDPVSIMQRNKDVYKDIIATINYYNKNPLTKIKWEVDKSIKFYDYQKRYERTFYTILKYLAEYCESQEEFNDLSKELYGCYKKYDTLITKDTIMPVIEQVNKQSILN